MPTTWTDDPTGKTVPFKAQHVNELRAAIEAVTGVTVIPWGRGNRVSASTNIHAQDLLDLRSAIGPGGAGTVWGQRSIAAGSMLWTQTLPATSGLGQVLRATHVDDLRRWFNTSETGVTNYQFPQVRPLVFGINPSWVSLWDDPNQPPPYNDDQMMDKIKAAGATCVRAGIDWANIEATQGSYNYTAYDARVQRATDRGLVYIAVVGTAPGWASASKQLPVPGFEANFRAFVTNMAQHFQGRIHHYEFNNEPDNSSTWTGAPNPNLYAQYLQWIYQNVKAVDPNAWVSTGGVENLHYSSGGTDGRNFIENVYNYLRNNHVSPFPFDAVAGHPYTGVDIDESGITGLRSLMSSVGDTYKPIWLTEYGWDVGSVGESNQSTYLQDSLNWLTNPAYNYVTIASYNLLSDLITMTGLHQLGLCKTDLSARQAYGTFSAYSKPTT